MVPEGEEEVGFGAVEKWCLRVRRKLRERWGGVGAVGKGCVKGEVRWERLGKVA
jgi:hypothetical protein